MTRIRRFWRRLHNGEASDRELVFVTVATLAVALLVISLPMERVYMLLDSLIAWRQDISKQFLSYIRY